MQRRPEIAGIGREGEADRGGMGRKDEARPILRRGRGEAFQAQWLGVRPVKGIAQRLLQTGNLGELGMLGVRIGVAKEPRHMAPEVPCVSPVGRVRGNIGAGQLGEPRIADTSVQLLVVAAQHLNEAEDVAIAVDAKPDIAALLGAVVDFTEDRVVAGKHAALEAFLQRLEPAHAAASIRLAPSTSAAIPLA